MTKRDRILLAVIAVVALVGGLYWFVVKPAKADADARSQELTALQDETGVIRDQIARLEKAKGGELAQSIEGFRLAKAVPDRAQIPGAIVQLQRLAERSNVTLGAVRTTSTTDYGGFRATELEIVVSGRFFDVDDFMFRMHRQVSIDEQDRPRISGRLFAVKSFEIQLADGEGSGTEEGGPDRVEGNLKVLVFSAPPASAGAIPGAATVPASNTASAAPASTASTGGTR